MSQSTLRESVGLAHHNWMRYMKKRWIFLIAAALFLAGVGLYSYQRGSDVNATREAMLALMPGDACAIVYADVAQIRTSAFAAELYNWAPQPQVDPDYARFLRNTGFDYEHDLDRLAIAFTKHGSDTTVFAIADGRFVRNRIETYISESGSRVTRDGHEVFLVPVSGSPRKTSLAFFRPDRIALTDDADPSALFKHGATGEDERQWRDRFERLAGSPIFAVLRQDALAGNLAGLLSQLLWVTLAGKPEGDRLRLVAEGEYGDDRTARQLDDVLNGILVLAQAGLNGPDTRRELDPQTREAYLEVLRGTDVSRIDRGETKSVRVILDVTPKLLAAARAFVPLPSSSASVPSPPTSPSAPPNTAHRRAAKHKSGR
jgi:hypothetical protein